MQLKFTHQWNKSGTCPAASSSCSASPTPTHTLTFCNRPHHTDPKLDVSAEPQIVTKSPIYMNDTLKSTLYWESQGGFHSAPQYQGATILSHSSQVPQLASPHWNEDTPQEMASSLKFSTQWQGDGICPRRSCHLTPISWRGLSLQGLKPQPQWDKLKPKAILLITSMMSLFLQSHRLTGPYSRKAHQGAQEQSWQESASHNLWHNQYLWYTPATQTVFPSSDLRSLRKQITPKIWVSSSALTSQL